MNKAVVLFCVFLAGCNLSPEYRMARAKEACAEYGFKEGTEAWSQCLQNEELSRKDRMRSALSNAANNPAPAMQPYQAPVSNRITCYSQGNTTNCH